MIFSIAIPFTIPPTADRPFTRYEIQITQNGETWSVQRRFSSFVAFNDTIVKQFKKMYPIPRFPKKKIGANDPLFLEERRLQLLSYMTNLIKLEKIRECHTMDVFLQIKSHKQQPKRSGIDTRPPISNPQNPMDLFRSPQSYEEKKPTFSARVGSPVDFAVQPYPESNPNSLSNSFMNEIQGRFEDREDLSDDSDSDSDPPIGEKPTESFTFLPPVPAVPEFPLHDAIRSNDLNRVKELLNGSDDDELLESSDQNMYTPLQLATLLGHHLIVSHLLTMSADITVNTREKDTILHIAAKSKSAKTLEVLLSRDMIDVNYVNNQGLTPLHILAKHVPRSYDTNLLRTLLNRNALPNVTDVNGAEPLHYCAATGKTTWCELLLRSNSNVEVKDKNNETPLHYAAKHAQSRVVSLLLDHNADISAKGKEGDTPLDLVLKARQAKTARVNPVSNNFVFQFAPTPVLY